MTDGADIIMQSQSNDGPSSNRSHNKHEDNKEKSQSPSNNLFNLI